MSVDVVGDNVADDLGRPFSIVTLACGTPCFLKLQLLHPYRQLTIQF